MITTKGLMSLPQWHTHQQFTLFAAIMASAIYRYTFRRAGEAV